LYDTIKISNLLFGGIIVAENLKIHLENLINELHLALAEQKKAYDAALETGDTAQATAMMMTARANIQRQKKWIDELLFIQNEIESLCERYSKSDTAQKAMPTDNQQIYEIGVYENSSKRRSFKVWICDKSAELNLSLSKHIKKIKDSLENSINRIKNTLKTIRFRLVSFIHKARVAQDNKANPKGTPDTPAAIILFGKTIAVNGWKDVLVKVCEAVILKKPYIAAGFSGDNELRYMNNACFSFDKSREYESAKLSNGLYINIEGNSREIYERCNCMLILCGCNQEDFHVKSMEEINDGCN
jgi:hypothetical protein